MLLINIGIFHYTHASVDVKTDIDTISGLQQTIFNTTHGNIIISLPDDIQAGDVISGTITVQKNKEKTDNLEKLYKYTISVNNEIVPISDNSVIKFTLPKSSTGGVTYLVLRDEQGDELSRNYITYQNYVVNYNALSSPSPWEFQTPSLGRSGRYSVVKGPFDGNFGTTSVSVGKSSVIKIAESPRQITFENPVNVLGDTELLLVERGVEVRRKYQNIQVVKLDETPESLFNDNDIDDSKQEYLSQKNENTTVTPVQEEKPVALNENVKGGYIKETELNIENSHSIIGNNNLSDIKPEENEIVKKDLTSFSDSSVVTTLESMKSEEALINQPNYTVQIASYKNEKDAIELSNKLELKGYDVRILKAQIPEKGTWYRVRMGNFQSKSQANTYGLKLTREESLVSSIFVTRSN